MYHSYNNRPVPRHVVHHRRQSRWPVIILVIVTILCVISYVTYCILRPIPEARLIITPPVLTAQVKVKVPWITSSERQQSAFGADGYGLLARSGPETPSPTASVTKVITALAVLEKKPLKLGQQGPSITFTERDAEIYNEYIAKDGAAVPVAAGATATEYQALQALLLPSANNIADTLVNWAFGDMTAYTTFANSYVDKLGLKQTTVTDASGFAPTTTSTASDLVRLGDIALDHPVFAQIVNQKTAVFPGFGTMYNVNSLLGESGIRGIKTGNTDEAGGCYLSAADVMVGDTKITVITAIMGASSRPQAMRDSLPLIQSAPSQFQTITVVEEGKSLGKATTAWGSTSDIVASQPIRVTAWNGTSITPTVKTGSVTLPAGSGVAAGSLTLDFNGDKKTSNLKLASSLAKPSLWWKLKHPY